MGCTTCNQTRDEMKKMPLAELLACHERGRRFNRMHLPPENTWGVTSRKRLMLLMGAEAWHSKIIEEAKERVKQEKERNEKA